MTALFSLEPFTGGHGENISLFLRRLDLCLKPDLDHYDKADHNEVKLMILEYNLRGQARAFYDEQPSGIKEDWNAMCKKLTGRFYTRSIPNQATIEAMERVACLSQGSKSLGDYVAAARQIHAALPRELKPRLKEVMCADLTDRMHQVVIERVLEMHRTVCSYEKEPGSEQICRMLYMI